MKLLLSAAALLSLSATGATARALPAAPAPTDTIVLRLPNKALMTLVVQNAAQLRELKQYQLDSLTSRLASYIAQTEAAASTGAADQVTMRFYPDKDHPGQHLPAEVRVTARKDAAGQPGNVTTRTQVEMQKNTQSRSAYGVTFTDDAIIFRPRRTAAAADSAHRARREARQGRGHIGLRMDFGLNTLVNNSSTVAGVPSLKVWGWGVGYSNYGFNFVQPLVYRGRAKLAITFGPEFSTNRLVLNGNEQWVVNGSQTGVERAPDGKQLDESRLSLTSLNLPVMLRFKLLNKHDNKTVSAGIGGFGGYRLGSSIETEYKLAGSDAKHEDELKGQLNLNNWQYGLQGEIGYHGLRLFARYNLNELFREGQGPQTHLLTMGIRILGY